MAVRPRRSLQWAALAALAACSSPESAAPAVDPAETGEPTAPVEDPPPTLPAIEPFDTGGDEAAALRDIGALPAWDGLIQRDRFLARRGDEGVVFGRLGRHDGVLYLHDETAPQLCLGYRFAAPAGAPVSAGDRVVTWGAWSVDDDRRWVWTAARIQKLPSTSAPAPARPPLAIASVAGEPDDATVPSLRKSAGTIAFYVRTEPIEYGRGWSIADTVKGDHAARLLLPGERRPYGGQMPPTDRETWPLRPGVRYAVDVEKFRRREGEAPTMRAKSPPLEIRAAAE